MAMIQTESALREMHGRGKQSITFQDGRGGCGHFGHGFKFDGAFVRFGE